jgi:amino acid adenylation domain-containing protein
VKDGRERLAALSDEQRRLLASRLRQRARPATDAGIARQDRQSGDFPLSFAQQRFWFLHQLAPDTATFTVTEPHRLQGSLDVDALERSINGIVARHSVLRTTFPVIDGKPVQRVAPSLAVRLHVEDLTADAGADREALCRTRAAHALQQPWDLEAGPLVRAFLWRLAPDDHFFLLITHHIVSDGWSKRVLLKELLAFYQAFTRNERSTLLDLPIQYTDYAVWQHEWLKGAALDPHLDYWKQHLADAPPLQMSRGRTAVAEIARDAAGVHHWQVLSPEITQALRAMSQREGVTLFMSLLAVFAAVLARHTGQTDVVVGSPIANRNRAETEDLIGCFMNPLPLRLDVGGRPTFRELLRRARAVALGAYAHQDVPFDLLVRTLHPRRDAGVSPLFQVMFLLQNLAWGDLELSGATLGSKPMAIGGGDDLARLDGVVAPGDLTYPVALEMFEIGPRLAGRFEYALEYADTMSRMPGHFRTLLQAVLEEPDRPVADLGIVTPSERRQLLERNGDRRRFPGGLVHELFEAEAARAPEATAVVFGADRVSYGDLNARANRLAHHLRSLGVGPEVPVAILVDRSADMIATVLAVMKAGGAYVPLDPAHPIDRLAYTVGDAAARVVLTTSAVRERLAGLERAGGATAPAWVCIDAILDAEGGDAASFENPDAAVVPSNIAYVIYTSGSTGRPKGTIVSHASLANAFRAWEEVYGLRSLRSHLQMASLSFDVCTGDIVRALCSGATLVIVPHELLFAPARLYALMREEQVQAAEFVPVVLRDVIRYLESTGQSLDFMRLLVAGSDGWYNHEYLKVRELCGPSTRVVNSYGLTEATIDSTWFEGADGELPGDGMVPIGRAFPNTGILLLDRDMQLVPAGTPGEITIAGEGLARGYLGRPDLTAERFVPHPFSPAPGARVYRTGDLGRYMPDGTIEMLGRIDQQVKLRGFRIELAEVESVLAGHPSVKDAAAAVREDRPGDRRLVGYVVAAAGAVVNPADLRRFVRETLPDYMVPSAIVVLAALPVSANGKVDRAALPAPDGERRSDEAFVAPRTATERQIAEIWREVLAVEQVGLNDNFFDLGGHSLLIVQMQARLTMALGRTLTVVDLFRFPTVSSLAGHVSASAGTAGGELASARGRAQRSRDALRRGRAAADSRGMRDVR